jgi:hypothetical protein
MGKENRGVEVVISQIFQIVPKEEDVLVQV